MENDRCCSSSTRVVRTSEEYEYLYAVIRGDLHMTAGKAAAQAGHAFTDALMVTLAGAPQRVSRYMARDDLGLNAGTKIVLLASSRLTLDILSMRADFAGIPNAIVTDRHHVMPPHFDGSPIVTALGIGPCTKKEAYPILGRLPLF